MISLESFVFSTYLSLKVYFCKSFTNFKRLYKNFPVFCEFCSGEMKEVFLFVFFVWSVGVWVCVCLGRASGLDDLLSRVGCILLVACNKEQPLFSVLCWP